MKEINRFRIDYAGGCMRRAPDGVVCYWSDVEVEFRRQLPDGMEDCIIQFKECDKCERHWLTAANWVDHGCPHCERDNLKKEVQEMTARAFAAVWLLVQENVPLNEDLQQFHESAREALMGKDKERIAKLEDKVRNLEEALRERQNPPPPALYRITGFKKDNRNVGHVLALERIAPNPHGGLDIEVRLP